MLAALAAIDAFAPRHAARCGRAAAADAPQASTRPQGEGGSLADLPPIKAAVIVPGFLTGKDEFLPLARSLTEMGIPSVVVPFPNWHWLPCLGGRSMRPMLERIDLAVRHLAATAGDLDDFERIGADKLEKDLEDEMSELERRQDKPSDPQLLIPNIDYNAIDLYQDFRNNPGGVLKVGGSAVVEEYPLWVPRGRFPEAPEPQGKVALIGHSAGGWICRAYLSKRDYGGRSYGGIDLVHSLITLGSPHGNAPGPAFKGVEWVNSEVLDDDKFKALAVAGTGYMGDSSGSLTQGAYSFCCPNGSDGSSYDGDGVTPDFSALAMQNYVTNADTMVLEDVGHFRWSEVFGGDIVAPELTKEHAEGRPWYGDKPVIEKWAGWL
ncbi:hypothetical protein THAOC_20034 [Thalassiosira oceanica]|uniref:GPI inositol-deacylase n=1 Tax=Thalassiosira oceanica TaxID=159749 RepID=K0S4I0_THAOC|nr:hypothetical protein THAOC_20034 [Thalassiosira oceanica]|eukprot:EJK59709.1 hypothetical protein THAOC_20034 [Thalassiosira oceanica]